MQMCGTILERRETVMNFLTRRSPRFLDQSEPDWAC